MEKSDEENQQQLHRNPMSMPPTPRGLDDPWLVFFHGKRGQNQTFYSISECYNHVKNIPCLRRRNICSCSHGWMVLSGTCSECFLLNPTTMEKIQLPPLDFQFKKCVLSSSPVDPSCIVLFISCPRDDIITFRFCRPKKEGTTYSWIKQEVKFEDAAIEDATSCDGKIYGLMDKANEILIVEVVDAATLKVWKMEIEGCMPFFQEGPAHRVLVESCGKLYVVWKIYAEEHMPYEIQDFEVLKLDFSRKIWERVKSLGNRAFFVGPGCCTICCSASAKESESGIIGNTIYFTMAGDRSLYAYNLEEKSINVSLPCPNVQHSWSQPNWFLPSCLEE